MKILIISQGRSGSTNLLNYLSNSIPNHLSYNEPFNVDPIKVKNTIPLDLKAPNLIVKTLVSYVPSNCYTFFDTEQTIQKIINYYLNSLIPNFNKIVLLTRMNEIENVKSYYNSLETNKWHSPYHMPSSFSFSKDQRINSILSNIRNNNSILYRLSEIIKVPITYYEDIFTGDKNKIQNFLKQSQIEISNFEKFYSYLDPKNRYRQN